MTPEPTFEPPSDSRGEEGIVPAGERHPVLFVGAGPGDPELITLKGAQALGDADVVVWAGSLVHPDLLEHCRADAQVHDSAGLDLGQIVDLMAEGYEQGRRVVRLHTGDPSLYGAIAEQIEELDARDVPYAVVPGVSSFAASAAALNVELTTPEVSQTVILTRRAGRTPVPEGQDLVSLASHRATLCIFLSVGQMTSVVDDLKRHYPAETPVAVVANATWPEQRIVRGTLSSIAAEVDREGITKTAMIIVGDVLLPSGTRSKLYDRTFAHGYRTAASGTDDGAVRDTESGTLDGTGSS